MELEEIKNLIIKTKESNETTLDLSFKELKSLPPEINKLKNLTQLIISDNLLTSLPLEITELKNLTRLDISNNQLGSIPSEVLELKNLILLDIAENNLSSLPSKISELENLTILNIANNQLSSLPFEITKLKRLTHLNIAGNQLRSLPSEITELKRLTQLNVSENKLSSIPSEITELRRLTQLSIYGNRLTFLPSEIFRLRDLTYLNISGTKLSSLPHEISWLKKLTQLNISGNQLSLLPSEIFDLENLTKLDISYNQLNSLPSEIAKLKKLTQLNIAGNRLHSLPPEISSLENLTQLSISYNQLSSLPPEISSLENLTQLNLAGNQLHSLPYKISRLKYLTQLDISNNQLSSLPFEIFKLKKLTQVNIFGNQLSSLPPEISGLESLTQLNLAGNRLRSLPPGISKLKYLIQLDISNNQLSSLPSEIFKLKNLAQLNISANQLSSLSPRICELKNLLKLDISNNPLEDLPIEITKKGKDQIFDYFKNGEKKPLSEVKVLLVGEGGAGKTSLVKRLFGIEVDGNEPQTQGINIKKWPVRNGDREINANFWDFGGQEIMHATHQFFLSKRSLYILVLDGRKDEKPEYWLKMIENFGGDSPVLVVINKIDENPSFELNRKFLKEKYPTIRDFFRLSCKSNEGVEDFSKALQEELKKVKHLEIKWPKSWFSVKSKLEKICPSCLSNIEDKNSCEYFNFIEYNEYKKICEDEGVKSESGQATLVDFLHDLGVILHFRDIPLLNTHVLEPEWVTSAVYRIVTSKEIADFRGILKPSDMLPGILKQDNENKFYYPPHQYGFILNLMKKFELSYDLDDRTVLLPNLLEIQEPNFDFEYAGALRFIIDYDFLPPSVMPRFIVKMSEDIKDDLRWLTGVVLEDEDLNSSAVVRADNEAKRISIYVNGRQKRDYFAVILQKFREINNSFEKLNATEKIPLPDKPEISISYKHLIKLEGKGIEFYIPDGSDYEYNVSALLGTVINRSSERALIEEILRITEMNRNSDKEILKILRTLQEIETEYDTEDTLLEKANNVFSVQPTVLGVGVNLNEIVRLYIKWRQKKY